MELFRRRPLCVCCGLFLLSSYLCARLVLAEKVILALICLGIAALLAAVCLIFKIRKYGFISLIMCFLFVFGALLNNSLRIDLPHQRSREYVGERVAEMDIVSAQYYSDHSSSYVVDVTEVDGEGASFKAILVFGFGAEKLLVGDTLLARVEFYEMDASIMGQTGYERTDREDVALTAALYEPEGVMVRRFDRSAGFFQKLFSKNGVSVILDEMRTAIRARLVGCLGEEAGGMANAYLTGDTSGLSVSTVRDYRRSGISHLFAVSGLHVSILLGAVEALLKRLRCRKTVRCAILSVCAFGLLCLTGFSMSAMRSVFMLIMVYVAFLTSEENDSVTSLFASVAIIILLTPYAIYELGMWMSFFATLGVITVYPLAQKAILPRKRKNRFARAAVAFLRACALTAIGTVAATMFLLPISWAIFGEISVVAILANIVMSPLSTVFLILSALAAILGGVPVISILIRYASVGVSSAMTSLAGSFSGLDVAAVSLRYPFAKWLVIIFSVAVVIMLVIKVPRKILFAIPPVALAASFCVCLICFNAINPSAVSYKGQGHREVISVTNDESLAIIDMSDGYYSRFYDAYVEASVYGATQVDSIVLTSVSSKHVSSLDYFLRSNVVKAIYIPEPYSDSSRELSMELALIAMECGVEVRVYDGSAVIDICDGIGAKVICSQNGDKRSVAVFVASEDEVCGYVDAFAFGSERGSEVAELVKRCDTLIIGNNGVPKTEYSFDVSDNTKIIYSSEELMKKSGIVTSAENIYFNTRKVFDFRIVID